MKPYGPYDLSPNTLQIVTTDQSPDAGTAVFLNESPYTLKVVNEAAAQYFVVSAWTQDKLILGPQYSGRLLITPIQDLTFSGANPATKVYVMIYARGEAVPGVYPMNLGRLSSVANQIGTGQTFDAILELPLSASVDCTIPGTAQVFSLTASSLNLAGVSTETPGYLILGYVDINSGRETFVYTRGNKEPVSLAQTVTVPGSTSGNQQVFTLEGSGVVGWLTCLMFQGLSAGLNIANVELKRGADPVGAYQGIIVGNNLTAATVINVANIYAPEGFGALGGSGGINVRLTSNNTGAQASYTMFAMGCQLAYDEVKLLISYKDWQNNTYDLGWTTVGEQTILPLNFLVPIPITNPAQTNFGSIVFTVFQNQLFYNTHYTFDVVIPCIVSQLAPV